MDYIKIKGDGILALGAQTKSSFCFVKQGRAYVSETDGDLSSMEHLKAFENRIKKIQKKLKIKLKVIACDLHPEYISSKLAKAFSRQLSAVSVKAVQHHEAHVASCIADSDIKGNVIGVAFDGTGFGLDENIWGGEFFVGALKGLKRAAHLKYIPMPGGEAPVREPWRMALSYLYNIYGADFKRLKIDFLKRLDREKAQLLVQIIDKRINSPLTSSMGRLFDAVSSLTGICDVAKYEAQAAVDMEKAVWAQGLSRFYSGQATPNTQGKYNFKYKDNGEIIVIDWTPAIKGVIKDLQAKRGKAEISMKFHNAVCYMIKDACVLLRKKYKINKVCMTGGVFQNKYIAVHAKPLLEKEKFKVYLHKNLPAHDGNIALGQAVLAGA